MKALPRKTYVNRMIVASYASQIERRRAFEAFLKETAKKARVLQRFHRAQQRYEWSIRRIFEHTALLIAGGNEEAKIDSTEREEELYNYNVALESIIKAIAPNGTHYIIVACGGGRYINDEQQNTKA